MGSPQGLNGTTPLLFISKVLGIRVLLVPSFTATRQPMCDTSELAVITIVMHNSTALFFLPTTIFALSPCQPQTRLFIQPLGPRIRVVFPDLEGAVAELGALHRLVFVLVCSRHGEVRRG
jgi:hypothetical protein